ncbi:hypothetical protein M0813_00198 [Anaeramoeba flamelloides]|uniref:DNA-directed RNA polymerases I, II, and III subunit RPABC1 n=1 Tax=Anaeramoeba flamelloides TaxID=1746091 RepID=A0AAV7Z5T5_9EUKA|nr:hypothetical protein M0812_20960 [Anaeramoeba flamelloides]KAJ3437363.1 hypothetical protein M0812_16524 [Anaeramoeba flamelloides]KAJ6249039.1 hypothetical protein M0813_00198 [Anaeramoeba flamelloides]
MSEDQFPYKLYQINRTILQMLRDRKYIVSKEQLEMKFPEFREQNNDLSRTSLELLATKIDDPSIQILVFFPEDEKVSVEMIRSYVEKMKGESVARAILILQRSLSHYSKKFITKLAPEIIIETFFEFELLVNITEHQLVPKHEVLSEEESKVLLKRYRVKPTQLPRIKVTDPVARYLGLRRGQIVKITRPSETAGRYVCYRFVV